MILKPVFDEKRDFWGNDKDDYSKESETDLRWWALKLSLMRCLSDDVLKELGKAEENSVDLQSALLWKKSQAEAIEEVKKIRSEILWELQRVGEARAK